MLAFDVRFRSEERPNIVPVCVSIVNLNVIGVLVEIDKIRNSPSQKSMVSASYNICPKSPCPGSAKVSYVKLEI